MTEDAYTTYDLVALNEQDHAQERQVDQQRIALARWVDRYLGCDECSPLELLFCDQGHEVREAAGLNKPTRWTG